MLTLPSALPSLIIPNTCLSPSSIFPLSPPTGAASPSSTAPGDARNPLRRILMMPPLGALPSPARHTAARMPSLPLWDAAALPWHSPPPWSKGREGGNETRGLAECKKRSRQAASRANPLPIVPFYRLLRPSPLLTTAVL